MTFTPEKAAHFAGTELGAWLNPLGLALRLFFRSLSPAALRNIRPDDFGVYFMWMGQKSFHMVIISAVFVSVALTLQCVIEMQKYRAQDLSGAVISIGLMRELGPLTVSLAWCSRVSALIAEEARNLGAVAEKDLAEIFLCPRYLAAVTVSIPLGIYGLFFAVITAALFARMLGVSSANDFLESAKSSIGNKDVFVYFLKLILVNPTIGVFAGAAAGRLAAGKGMIPVAANAVTATFLTGYIANTIITFAAYLP